MGRGRGGWEGDGGEDGESEGGAFGQRGRGAGGEAPEEGGDVGVEKTKLKSMLGKGKYVGAYSMKGEPPKGSAAAEYSEVHRAAQTDAMDALDRQKVPATHRDFVRDYFDAIRAGEKR